MPYKFEEYPKTIQKTKWEFESQESKKKSLQIAISKQTSLFKHEIFIEKLPLSFVSVF